MNRITPFLAAAVLLIAGCSTDQPTGPGSTSAGRVLLTTVSGSLSNPTGTIESVAADGSDRQTILQGILTVPPRGGKMVFVPNGDSSMYYGNLDGSGRIEILHAGVNANDLRYPIALTPDGKRILYRKYDSDDDTLMIGDPTGSNLVFLGLFSDDPYTTVFSPDGARVAFFRKSTDHATGSIQVVRIDGSDSHAVVSDIDMEVPWRIDWSPDGTRLLFAARTGDYGGDLFTVNADGSGLQNITNDTLDQVCGAWSPDGTRIACTQGSGAYDLQIMNADGSGRRLLVGGTPQPEFYSTWSPDGASILFTEGEKSITGGGTYVSVGGGALSIVNVATSAVTTIANGQSAGYWIR